MKRQRMRQTNLTRINLSTTQEECVPWMYHPEREDVGLDGDLT